jgi:hypothetical protein
LGFSHSLIKLLHIPPHTPLALLTHLTTAFGLSGFFHALILSSLPTSTPRVTKDILIFFILQIPAIIFEKYVIDIFTSLQRSPSEEAKKDEKAPSQKPVKGESKVWICLKKILGYAWVWSWLIWSGWWGLNAYYRVGMQSWDVPVPVFKRAVETIRGYWQGWNF